FQASKRRVAPRHTSVRRNAPTPLRRSWPDQRGTRPARADSPTRRALLLHHLQLERYLFSPYLKISTEFRSLHMMRLRNQISRQYGKRKQKRQRGQKKAKCL